MNKCHIKIFFVQLCLLFLGACVPNFNPETDSDIVMLDVNVDIQPVVKWMSVDGYQEFDQWRIPSDASDVVSFRVSLWCYDKDGTFLWKKEAKTKDASRDICFSRVRMTKGERHTIVAFMDFEVLDKNIPYSAWLPLSYKSLEGFHISTNWSYPGNSIYNQISYKVVEVQDVSNLDELSFSITPLQALCLFYSRNMDSINAISYSFSGLYYIYLFDSGKNKNAVFNSPKYKYQGWNNQFALIPFFPTPDNVMQFECNLYRDAESEPQHLTIDVNLNETTSRFFLELDCTNGEFVSLHTLDI